MSRQQLTSKVPCIKGKNISREDSVAQTKNGTSALRGSSAFVTHGPLNRQTIH